jgi:hypothetical protein
MADPASNVQLIQAVILLGAAVVVVPLFNRLGLGSVLGYLVARDLSASADRQRLLWPEASVRRSRAVRAGYRG